MSYFTQFNKATLIPESDTGFLMKDDKYHKILKANAIADPDQDSLVSKKEVSVRMIGMLAYEKIIGNSLVWNFKPKEKNNLPQNPLTNPPIKSILVPITFNLDKNYKYSTEKDNYFVHPFNIPLNQYTIDATDLEEFINKLNNLMETSMVREKIFHSENIFYSDHLIHRKDNLKYLRSSLYISSDTVSDFFIIDKNDYSMNKLEIKCSNNLSYLNGVLIEGTMITVLVDFSMKVSAKKVDPTEYYLSPPTIKQMYIIPLTAPKLNPYHIKLKSILGPAIKLSMIDNLIDFTESKSSLQDGQSLDTSDPPPSYEESSYDYF